MRSPPWTHTSHTTSAQTSIAHASSGAQSSGRDGLWLGPPSLSSFTRGSGGSLDVGRRPSVRAGNVQDTPGAEQAQYQYVPTIPVESRGGVTVFHGVLFQLPLLCSPSTSTTPIAAMGFGDVHSVAPVAALRFRTCALTPATHTHACTRALAITDEALGCLVDEQGIGGNGGGAAAAAAVSNEAISDQSTHALSAGAVGTAVCARDDALMVYSE